MSHLTTCGDAPNCTWTDLAIPTLAGVNCAKHCGRNLSNNNYRGLDEEDQLSSDILYRENALVFIQIQLQNVDYSTEMHFIAFETGDYG